MFDRRLIVHFDFLLFFTVLLICGLGVLNLNSLCSSEGNMPMLFYKQLSWILVGLFFLLIIININYVSIIRYGYYLHGIALVLVVLVLFIGKTKLGSQRWLVLGPISIQPSELVKITFLLALSKFYAENISPRPYSLLDLFVPSVLLCLTFFPVFLQPDLGTAGIIVLIFASFLFFLNLNKKMFFPFFGMCLAALPAIWFVLKDYQKKRILVFLDPDLDPLHAGYQLIQSKIAVGSGGFFGKGFKLGTQSQLRFLPEQHTDFVFSVWSEEWGLLGCCVLVFLYFVFLYRGFRISYNCKNFYGSYFAAGITMFYFMQFLINICMTIGLFPVVGVTLPFFSYGGSSIISCMVGLGILLSISMRKTK
jgi:rod shape determining protein RodA